MGMMYGIDGRALPSSFPGAATFNSVATAEHFSPCLIGAIAVCETLSVMSLADALTFVSGDGGHGVLQLTSSFPEDWQNLSVSIKYSIENFLRPAVDTWVNDYHLKGDPLIRAVGATYNAGLGNAIAGHTQGDAGKYTSTAGGVDYATRTLSFYKTLVSGKSPV